MVVTRHLSLPRGNSLPGRAAAVLIRRRVAGQIAISRHTAAHIDGPSTVILAGVDPAPASSDPSSSTTVLVAARLEAEKRVDLAIRAFAASHISSKGWRLQIAGAGSCMDNLRELAVRLSLEASVDFLGYRSDVRHLMGRVGLFLAPTPDEGLGLSVIEAMAAGRPVVADGSGGHLESLGDAGLPGLYLSGDPEDAAAKLRDLVGDAHLRDSYGSALRDRQQSLFTLPAQVAATDDFYRKVAGCGTI